MATIKLAVEEDFDARGYKRVHVAGCRDLRDPEPVEAADLAGLVDYLVGVYGGYADVGEVNEALAPCARRALGGKPEGA